MAKITFMGAGSTVFAKNVLGDCMYRESLHDVEIALYDIDAERLKESQTMLGILNKNINKGRAEINSYFGVDNRKKALHGADYVINAIQVGGYEPSTVIDFEIPKKYGLRQTIADTLGIGGIFRGLRTAPVMLDFAKDIEKVCPDAWFLNYTNPMAILTGAMLRASSVKTVGLCHSVQVVAKHFLEPIGMWLEEDNKNIVTEVAGINHMAWLMSIKKNGIDIYPEAKRKSFEMLEKWRKAEKPEDKSGDMVRRELMKYFGYYITESSEHNAEYHPYFIKDKYPHLVAEFNIPLDEYPRRCVEQIKNWKEQSKKIVDDPNLSHELTNEYGSGIINAMETNIPFKINGNVLNTGLITNLPDNSVVEVPCLVDSNGVQGCYVGALPEQCAALNRTNINVQLLTIEASLKQKREYIYQAAMLDPHTASELSLDDIVKLCDELIEAHGDMLPEFK